MNTIHSSSLAFYPVGYNRPQAERLDNRRDQQTAADTQTNGLNQQELNLPKTSSTAQIQAALAESGLTAGNNDNQPTDSRTLKALNAYTENRNQSAHMKVAEIISGIDLYV